MYTVSYRCSSIVGAQSRPSGSLRVERIRPPERAPCTTTTSQGGSSRDSSPPTPNLNSSHPSCPQETGEESGTGGRRTEDLPVDLPRVAGLPASASRWARPRPPQSARLRPHTSRHHLGTLARPDTNCVDDAGEGVVLGVVDEGQIAEGLVDGRVREGLRPASVNARQPEKGGSRARPLPRLPGDRQRCARSTHRALTDPPPHSHRRTPLSGRRPPREARMVIVCVPR